MKKKYKKIPSKRSEKLIFIMGLKYLGGDFWLQNQTQFKLTLEFVSLTKFVIQTRLLVFCNRSVFPLICPLVLCNVAHKLRKLKREDITKALVRLRAQVHPHT